MMKGVSADQLRTGGIIALEFFLVGTLMAWILRDAVNWGGEHTIAVIAILLLVLLCTVLVTVVSRIARQQGCIFSLTSELEVERQDSRTLQTQFDEAIEKRTMELQMVVGALNREIAERIQAEEEVRELQKQLSLILNSAGEGILGLDSSGRVTFMNTAASLMLGWEADELIGNTHHEFIHHTHPDGSAHAVEDCPIYMAYRDGVIHYKTGDIFWCKSGASFPVEYVSTPIKDRGMLTGAVVVFRDMNTFA
jgi:PAS domain S-box-containing protein